MNTRTIIERPVRFLASVTGADEAAVASSHGADIIDAKNPAEGALGALPVEVVSSIRRRVPSHIPVSATVGDLPCEPARVCAAVRAMAAAGVEFVKVGLFPDGDAKATVAALDGLGLEHTRLVGVLLADLDADFSLIEDLGRAGFAGVMLDTADKQAGPLPDWLAPPALAAFLERARAARLFAGFAGALREEHIPSLAALGPDVLGFRGALCRSGLREQEIDAGAVRAVRDAIRRATAPELVP